MVATLRAMGIRDPRVLAAFEGVPRHRFVPAPERDLAYADTPLPIGLGQTISQPYMVAAMTEALQLTGGEKVLEIGTGSGYQAAILSCLAAKVVTVERHRALGERAWALLAEFTASGGPGFARVTGVVGDGTLGCPEHAPYDAIVVTAASPAVPEPLLRQLADGGRLVVPVGGHGVQTLERHRRQGDQIVSERLMDCVFVPLIGQFGWKE